MEKLKVHRPVSKLPTSAESKGGEPKGVEEGKADRLSALVEVEETRVSPGKLKAVLWVETTVSRGGDPPKNDDTPAPKPVSSHISEWRTLSSGQKPSPPARKRKPSFDLLPLFEFEQRSPISPTESRSSRQIRLSRQLRRTSSLLEISDLRQVSCLSTASDSSTQSSILAGSTESRTATSDTTHTPSVPVKDVPPIPPHKPTASRPKTAPSSSPKKVTPFLHRPVRNEFLPNHTPHLPTVVQGPSPDRLVSHIRRPSCASPINLQIRIRTLSSRASDIPGVGGTLEEKASRTRRFLDRVGMHSDKRQRMRSSVAVCE